MVSMVNEPSNAVLGQKQPMGNKTLTGARTNFPANEARAIEAKQHITPQLREQGEKSFRA